ncbi:MAG TPA: hypothetical protein VE693_11060 [Gaiellaceae bacterium]|jgi:hypothetical protein|nr:hypothetical protein [Gaiellaceae bacterium]
MDDSLQRRAIWLAALTIVAFLFQTFGLGVYIGSVPLWRAPLFVATIASLVSAVALAGLVYVAEGLPAWRVPGRERSLAWSFALLWLAFLMNAVQVASALVQAVGDQNFE